MPPDGCMKIAGKWGYFEPDHSKGAFAEKFVSCDVIKKRNKEDARRIRTGEIIVTCGMLNPPRKNSLRKKGLR